ncbi:class I SAM-dependent methyltransferase [Oceanospirillum sediminis]|uniref:Class I SAM-dependent methyltransferase n=1 Tax=Oceanospirillum sediminis TaxID=2760088 RepID=A0A839IJU5_9GAMM|nr:class I SAM-dependent methyltransferase [Oceanospirillum sediminis]MBB1485613.1 class I SAM-dependent methyltransferase [Oceanospirillum sediminis]
MSKEILDFWNERAKLEHTSGSNDYIAKEIEQEKIISLISDNSSVAEFGCGNGETAIRLYESKKDINISAYDFSPEMVALANKNKESRGIGNISFDVKDITDNKQLDLKFDYIYTERMLINLANWDVQKTAIIFMSQQLKPGGKLILAENSLDGLSEINTFRESCGLDAINMPWHNQYLLDHDIDTLNVPGCRLVKKHNYTGTYYFVSRVINAYNAKQAGKEPSYDAEINKLALQLPTIDQMSQGKVWVFERHE